MLRMRRLALSPFHSIGAVQQQPAATAAAAEMAGVMPSEAVVVVVPFGGDRQKDAHVVRCVMRGEGSFFER